MSKSIKKWLILCLSIMMMFSVAAFIACDEPDTDAKLTIQTSLMSKVVDVEKYVNIPDGIVVDENGNAVDQEVKLKVYNPDGGIVWAWSGDFKVSNTGTWKVVYSSENADDVTVTLNCQDLSAPEYTVNGLKRFVDINQSVNLSVFSFRDYSGVDAEKSTVTVKYKESDDVWTDVEVKDNAFVPDKEGYYKVTASATDGIGRVGNYEFMIFAVSDSYKINELASGYVASYNTGVYEYLIGDAGTLDNVVGRTDPVVSYATDLAGALNNDAMKATVYKGENGATIRLSLPAVESGSLDSAGDNLTLRFKGESQVVSTYINNKNTTKNVASIGEADANGWRIMNIPLSAVGGSAYNIRSIEFVLGEEMNDVEEWYFDFVKMSHVLEIPEAFNYSYADGKVSWNAVDNAVGYEVSYDETSKVITESNIALPVGTRFKVKVLGDTANYLDSVWSNEIDALDTARGYITEYNNQYYVNTIESSNNVNTWWAAGVVTPTYVESGVVGAKDGDAMKVNMTIKTDGGTRRTSMNLNMPRVLEGTLSGDYFKVRIKIDNETASVGELWWNGTPSTGVAKYVGDVDPNGWQVLTMPTSLANGLYNLRYLTIGFLNFGELDSDLNVYVDWVKAMEALDAPTGLKYDNEQNKLTWNAVENAVSYVVTYDGQEYPVNGTSAIVPAGKQVAVKAIGTLFDDSDWSKTAVTLNIADGYVAEFNDKVYEPYIEDAVYQSFWKADAILTEYVKTGVVGAKDGDALKLTVDIAKCRDNKGMSYFVINLLGGTGANLVGDVLQIRFKATYDNGTKNVDPFGYVINGTTAVVNGLNGSADVISWVLDVTDADSNGWRTLSIDVSKIPGGVENMTSIGLMFYQYVGIDDGIGEIYLDYIKVAETLAVPSNITYADGKVSWTAVENATSYIVKYDGNEYTTNKTSMEVPGGKSVIVKATGEGYVESVWSAPYLTITTPKGYIADYNSTIYENMIMLGVPIIGDWWDPTNITPKYMASGVAGAENGDALAITIDNNKNGYSAVTINLPAVASGSLNGNTVQLRFKLMNGTESKEMYLYNLNGGAYVDNGLNISSADSNGWRTLSFTNSSPQTITSIGVGFYGLEKNGQCTLYLDYVKVVK